MQNPFSDPSYHRPLLIGASSRIGKMVLRSWREGDGTCQNYPAQYRATSSEVCRSQDLIWDISDGPAALMDWIAEYGTLSSFIVLAGVTPVTHTDMNDNVKLADAYLRAAQEAGIKRVLISSSSAVYGAGIGRPFEEESPCNPINPYGLSKRQMEIRAEAFGSADLEVCCLRIGNVAGADALLLNAPKTIADGPMIIDCYSNGHGPRRSYIGPKSLGDILARLATYDGPLPHVLNVAAPSPVYMDALADAASLPWRPRNADTSVPQDIVLNCSRLMSLLNIPPEVEAASKLISEWKENT